ncbi:MAG: Gldg family protein [Lachnospiraceae bacterium]|nr:Gldg family protein [Lachnospiraceae bacterium]
MTAIFLKEIRSYFKSLFGWLYLAAFTFFASLYFIGNNIQYGSPYISETLSMMVIVLIFILPLLTMRIIAEEKKQKTDQFLITAPIPLYKVILGKFFALGAIMLLSTFIVGLGAGVMAIYGSIPLWETVFSLLGFFLFGCECIAIGMFLSSVTEHQFIAAIFTYAVYIFTLLVPGFCSFILGSDKMFSKVINVFDIYAPFNGLMTGVVDLNDLLYIFSVIAIFLILTYKVFAKNSVQISAMGRNRFFISNLLWLVIIASIIGANFGCKYIPTKYTEFDVTKSGYYKITDDTKEVLKSLDQDVTIYVISTKAGVDETVKHYLDSYDSESKHIKIEYKSPVEFPTFYTQYTDMSLNYSSLILTMGDESRVIEYNDMFEYTYNASYGSYAVSGYDVEGQITAAINSMLNGDNKVKVYCLTGHGEPEIPSYIKDTMKKGNYSFEDLYLYGEDVPEDCDILIINGPQSDLSKEEVASLTKYSKGGGNLIMMASMDMAGCTNYDDFIETFEVKLTDGTVIENDYRYLLSVGNAVDPTCIIVTPDYASPYTTGTNKKNFLYFSRGITYDWDNIPADTSISDIFLSSDIAYDKNMSDGVDYSSDENSTNGPFRLGVLVRKYSAESEKDSNTIIIGSSAFLYEDFDEIVSRGNSDLAIEMMKSMVDNSVVTTIPVKHLTYDFITVSQGMILFYIVICMIAIPLIMLITGIVIMIVRRLK